MNTNYIKQKETKEINNNIDKTKNKSSSFNNIQISSTNYNNNSQKGITYSYISHNHKQNQNQNFQISSINIDNNKYSNNDSHQGISFISKKQKENPKNFQNVTKINSQQGITYIAPENKNNKTNKFLIESNNYSESNHKEFIYIAPDNNKSKEFQISSNSYNNQLNSTSQGISYIAEKKSKKEENNQKLKIISSSNINPQEKISYIAPETKSNYIIENIQINNKDNQKGISFIAPNKKQNYWIYNSSKDSHQEINYISSKKPKKFADEITSSNPNYNNYINSTQISYISNKSKKPIDYQLSTQNNTFTYIAPKKKESFKEEKVKENNEIKKDFEITSNNNNYIYISTNKGGKKEKMDDFKFNHNESMTFICEEKEIKKDNLFIQCDADKFKYVKDEATGAQVLEQENN